MLAFIDLETRVPPDHPLRVIKKLADQALKALSPDLDRMYADVGRPSIPPERLLKSSLLIALFTVDGTLIEAAASLKSFKPRDGDPPKTTDDDQGNPSVDFHGERRSNATHQSTTDPEARLLRKGKGKEAKLVFMAHALMENRHGMLVDFQTTQATGTAERNTVPMLVDQAKERGFHPKTLGGDKAYDTGDCVAVLRRHGVTPHVAQSTNGRSSAIDGRTTRHPGYAISQRIRKRVEEIFGWMKTVGGFRRTRYKGLDRTGLAGYLVATAYNLVRMAKLLELAKEAPKAQAA